MHLLKQICAAWCLALFIFGQSFTEASRRGRRGGQQLMYVWAGEVNRTQPDIVAVYDFTEGSSKFGKLLNIVPLRGLSAIGNEPHHSSFTADKRTFVAGGLLSLLKPYPENQEIFYFGVGDTYQEAINPQQLQVDWDASNPPKSAVTDEFVQLKNGGFAVSMMGRNDGMCPGKVIEISKDLKLVGEYPATDPVESPECFCPHGLDVDETRGVALSGDFLVPASILPSMPGPTVCSTFRIWNWNNRTISRTVSVPGSQGMMNALFIPNDPNGYAYIFPMIDGVISVHLLNPADGTYSEVLRMPNDVKSLTFVRFNKRGDRMYVGANEVGKLYVVNTVVRDTPVLMQTIDIPGSGFHYIRLDRNEKYVLACGYFLNAGKVVMDGDRKVHVFRVVDTGLVPVNSINIDLDDIIPGYQYRPHSMDFWWRV